MDEIREKIKEAVAKAIDSGTHINFATASEAIAKKLGLSERWIEYTHVEFRNKLNEMAYKRTPYKERVLLLPHCLRNSKECKAPYTDEGLQCTECGKCKIDPLIKEAKKLGYKGAFVCPGGSIVMELIKKYRPKAVLGVCCYKEAILAFDSLKGTKVAPQAVLLTRAGCIDTDVNVDEVIEKMRLIKEAK
ncbi:MAG: DUF116 domain-containing protein [Candidatus Diapherotrites archaeon]|nr:DUF116 domain-containing protein [Candidatus Diapherotrites archaeon]